MATKNVAGINGEVLAIEVPDVYKYSKLKLVLKLTELGLWLKLKAWMEEVGYYDAWLAAQELKSDHPLFEQILKAAEQVLGITDEQAKAILAECILDENAA